MRILRLTWAAAAALIICGVQIRAGFGSGSPNKLTHAETAMQGSEKQESSTAAIEKPTTLRIELSEKVRADVTNALQVKPETVQLAVKGVQPPPARADGSDLAGINLFLNKPDATAATSAGDPHFVGAVDLQPGAGRKAQNFLLDLSPALVNLIRTKQLDLSKPLEVTFVAIPSSASPGETKSASIRVESIQVSVPALRE